jgi:hypothetical protein
VEGYHFLLPEVAARPGDSLVLDIDGAHEESAQGFSMAVSYPAANLTIERVHFEETILEAIGTDFFEALVDPAEGSLTVGVLVDVQPPFEGNLIPNIDRPLTFLHVEARVSEDATEDLVLGLEDGLSEPPIRNLYVVNGSPVPVTELTAGVIHLMLPLGGEAFLRGDVNMDEDIDIADPVSILAFSFSGGREPACMDAADANDDGRVDVSDAVYLLNYLFTGGSAPPPPAGQPGRDLTEDSQGCDEPLFYLP